MADNTAQRAAILHVGPESSATSGASAGMVRALLQAGPAVVERCPDVYRAVARLLRPDGVGVRAVVVCMDEVGTPELEFFSILSRVGSRLQVYVYGAARSRNRTARAIQLGAAGEATEGIINGLIGSNRNARGGASATAASTETGGGAPPRVREPEAARLQPQGQPEQHALSDEGDRENRREESVAARVPWIEYADRPARKSPGADDAPRERVGRTPPSAGCNEPLLTDEELQALIGDDLNPFEHGDTARGENA